MKISKPVEVTIRPDGNHITCAGLKEKVKAFESLYDCRAEVLVDGNWYGPIDGKEFPTYSFHTQATGGNLVSRCFISPTCYRLSRH